MGFYKNVEWLFGRHCKLKSENNLFFLFLILRGILPIPKGYQKAIKWMALWNKCCKTFICLPTMWANHWTNARPEATELLVHFKELSNVHSLSLLFVLADLCSYNNKYINIWSCCVWYIDICPCMSHNTCKTVFCSLVMKSIPWWKCYWSYFLLYLCDTFFVW